MNLLGQKITLRRILGMIAGVVVIGIGIAVFKFSRLGNDSISALNRRLAELDGQPFRRKRIFRFMIRWLCPVFAAVILASSVANAFGIIKM